MSFTEIANIIKPVTYNAYISTFTTDKPRILNSGIISRSSILDGIVARGGNILEMPFWLDLVGEMEVLTEAAPLTVNGIGTSQDRAVRLIRGTAWGANDLASMMAGSNAVEEILKKIASFLEREREKVLLSTLKGVFDSASMAGHIYDGTADVLSLDMVLDAKQLLGDEADQLNIMIMHSKTYTEFQKNNKIITVPDSDTKIMFPTYAGYRIVIDDKCPVTGDIYTTFLAKPGIVGYGTGSPVGFVPFERGRDILYSREVVAFRQAYCMHVFGIKFTEDQVSAETPTNADLQLGTNWELVYEPKAIGLIKIDHKVA